MFSKKIAVDAREDDTGFTPLHYACLNGHHDFAFQLLDAGADANVADTSNMTALHLSAWNGKPQCVAVLLDAGAHINLQSSTGDTPLSLAATYGHIEAVWWMMIDLTVTH